MRPASAPRAVPGPRHTPAPSKGEWTLRNSRNARAPGEETVPRDSLRWSSWANALNGEPLVSWVREEVFPFYAGVAAGGVTDFMAGARLVIDEPTVLSQVVSQVNDLHLEQVDADTKGDLFEHVLRQIRQAGEARPVPHAPPRHPRHGAACRSPPRRDRLRSGCRHRRLPGRRLRPYPARKLVVGRCGGGGDGRPDGSPRPRRYPEPRRGAEASRGDFLRQRRGPADGPPRHHEPDLARSGQGADPAPRCPDPSPRPCGEGGAGSAGARLRRHSRQSAFLRQAGQGPDRRGREGRQDGAERSCCSCNTC